VREDSDGVDRGVPSGLMCFRILTLRAGDAPVRLLLLLPSMRWISHLAGWLVSVSVESQNLPDKLGLSVRRDGLPGSARMGSENRGHLSCGKGVRSILRALVVYSVARDGD
jgi:hypothetical protein